MTDERITIVGVEVEDFHRLRVAEIEHVPGEGLIRVTGPNRAGKTALLRSISATLGGAGEVLPDAIHEEATDGGRTIVRLSNGFTIERRYTEANPKGYLTATSGDGGKYGQEKINGWLGGHSFDPLAFFGLPSDRQREILFRVADDPELEGKLTELRSEHERIYEERTPWIVQKRKAGQVEQPEGERPEKVDVSGEMKRLRELQAEERKRSEAISELADLRRKHDQATARVEELRSQLRRAEREAEDLKEEVADAKERAKALRDPTDEIEEVKARIESAEAVQESLEPWREWDRAQKEKAEAEAKVEELTEKLDAIESEEERLIADAGFPVEGLSFDAEKGEPLLNGHPLEVASGRERIELSVAVAMAVNPDLRICLVDEANDMDLDGLEKLDALAREHGFQVWACRIGLEGPGEIVVEDGEAHDRGTADAAAS